MHDCAYAPLQAADIPTAIVRYVKDSNRGEHSLSFIKEGKPERRCMPRNCERARQSQRTVVPSQQVSAQTSVLSECMDGLR